MKDNRIHILVIPSWYPSGKDKLMGQYHKDFTAALNKRNDVYANMLYVERERLRNPIKYLRMQKVETVVEDNYITLKVHMLNLDPISHSRQMKEYVKKVLRTYIRYERTYGRPDVIHAQVTLPAGYAAIILGRIYGIPVVVTEHASYASRFFQGKDAKYSNFVLKSCTYTTVSKQLDNELKDYVNPAKLHRLPNQVDTTLFQAGSNKKKNDTLDLIQVCALRKNKRTDLIMDAIKILEDKYKYKKVHLTVIGDGFERKYFEEICKEKHMEENVTFVGQKTKEEIVKYFEKADISVIASELETFAIPGVESLAMGVPVVSTKCGGPEEYLDSKTGELCETGDAESMAKAIDKVYKNIDKYDKKYMREVANRYSEENVTDMAVKIYKEAIEKNEFNAIL